MAMNHEYIDIPVHYHYRPDGFHVLCDDPAPTRSSGNADRVTCHDCIRQWDWTPGLVDLR